MFSVMSLKAPLGCGGLLGLPCSWWPRWFWGVEIRCGIDWPSAGIFQRFSHDGTGLVCFGQQITEANSPSCYTISRGHTVHVLSVGASAPGWGCVCWVSPLTKLLFSPSHAVLPGRRSLCASHTWGVRSYAAPLDGEVAASIIWNSHACEICLCSLFMFLII